MFRICQQIVLMPWQINPYMSNPCHIEMVLTEAPEKVKKGDEVAEREPARLNSRKRGLHMRRAIMAS